MAVATRTLAIAASAAAAVFLISIYALGRKDQLDAFAACGAGRIAGGGAQIGGAFSLIDENGSNVTDKDVMARPALVYFGYTYCPDICPVDVARNAAAIDVLEERGYDVTAVFVSVDPHRDTPEVLKEWTDLIHPRLVGLTGSDEQIKAVASAYKTFYKTPENTGGDDYLVDHMTQTYLMIPGTGFADFFSREDSADSIADRTACFLDAKAAGN